LRKPNGAAYNGCSPRKKILHLAGRLLKKDSECFDRSQHERKIFSNIKSPPFVLPVLSLVEGSFVEGLREGFSSTC
jgi:hypothetical protein